MPAWLPKVLVMVPKRRYPPLGRSALSRVFGPARIAVVNLLRRALYAEATVLLLFGAGLAIAPRLLLVDVFSQRFLPDYAWVRIVGVQSVGFALLMVLVGQRLEELWWWAWAFALVGAAVGTVALLNALFSVPAHSEAWPWWLLAISALGFAAALLLGMARAGAERSEG